MTIVSIFSGGTEISIYGRIGRQDHKLQYKIDLKKSILPRVKIFEKF